jgi:hypothetical protein
MKILYIFLLSLVAATAMAVGKTVFENKTVDFKVTKPEGWQFVTAEADFESLNRIELTQEKYERLMQKYYTTPLVVFMRHPQPFDGLNPSFKVKIRPIDQFKGLKPTQILELFLPYFRKMYEGFSLAQPPTSTQIDGLSAGYMRINYFLTGPGGQVFPTSSEAWIVPRGNYFFMIGAGTRQDESTGTRAEIAEIIASLEL